MRTVTYAVSAVFLGITASAGAITVARLGAPQPLSALHQTWVPEPVPRSVAGLSLVDQSGAAFTEARLAGRWSVFFVGYMSCPDVCPTTLSHIRGLLSRLPALQVVFVSVDPERDKQAAIGPYVSYFHPDIVGLTGDVAQIDHLCERLGAAYSRQGATIDHTTSLFLVDPQGDVAGYLLRPSDADQLAADIRAAQDAWEPSVDASLWVREAPPSAPVLAAFGTLTNNRDARRSLVGADSPAFSRVELHQTIASGDMARMEPVAAVELPPGAALELAPGGVHLMLYDPVQPLPAEIPIQVHFDDGSAALLQAPMRR